jgi:hypothetical protein
LHVGSDKPTLLFGSRIIRRIDRPRSLWMVIVVTPLCEMVGKFKSWEISTSIFKINDNKLFVLVLRVQ